MKTRDRILETALRLFNEDGAAKVPINRIATELEMSPGNLHYHFPQKGQLVDRLLRRAALIAVDDFWLFLHLVFEKMFMYRFLYRDVDYVMTEYPALAPRLRLLTSRGITTVDRLCHQLAAGGALRASDADISVLALQMMMVATCWFTFARMLPETQDTGPGRAAYQVLSLLSPFLADDARQYMDYLRRKYV